MFNTPFIGLSVLVHVSVIFGHRLFYWLPKRVWRKKNAGTIGRLSGFAIIAAVFLVIFLNAVLLIHSSIADSRSSVHFLRTMVSDALAYAGRPITARVGGTSGTMSMAAAAVAPLVATGTKNRAGGTIITANTIVSSDCSLSADERARNYDWSVVNYLSEYGREYSFMFRHELAAQFGIADYEGSSEQNQVMLAQLFAKSDALASSGSSSCKN